LQVEKGISATIDKTKRIRSERRGKFKKKRN